MKTTKNTLLLVMLVGFISLTSCKLNRNVQASKTTTAQQKLNRQNSNATENRLPSSKKIAESELIKDDFQPFPPLFVAQSFRKSYPLATDLSWKSEMPWFIPEDRSVRDYRVWFKQKGKLQSLLYAANGELKETRVQILADQLPVPVFNTIKASYKEAELKTAFTYKNTEIEGSYLATVQPFQNSPDIVEMIFRENGTLVK